MRPVRVISLAAAAKRREEFARRNGHVPFSFFDAVDGRAMTDADIAGTGAFDPGVLADYGAHGVGVALSHRALWQAAAAGSQPVTIAEDDAVFRADFAERADAVLASLEPGWDIVLWGWNFDTVVQVSPMGGASPVGMVFDQEKLRGALDEFRGLRTPVQAWPLERAFGLLAYTLSPSGARTFLDKCFPLKPGLLYVPVMNYHMRNMGLDVVTNALYPHTRSFACFPPLAVSPNVRG